MTARKNRPRRSGIHAYETTTEIRGRVVPLGDVWAACTSTQFTVLPNAIFRTDLGLNAHAKSVLLHLLSWMIRTDPHRPLRQDSGYISQTDLAEWSGMSVASVRRAVAALVKRGFVTAEVTQPGEPLTYRIEIGTLIDELAERMQVAELDLRSYPEAT